jgi:hypothetical protein
MDLVSGAPPPANFRTAVVRTPGGPGDDGPLRPLILAVHRLVEALTLADVAARFAARVRPERR